MQGALAINGGDMFLPSDKIRFFSLLGLYRRRSGVDNPKPWQGVQAVPKSICHLWKGTQASALTKDTIQAEH